MVTPVGWSVVDVSQLARLAMYPSNSLYGFFSPYSPRTSPTPLRPGLLQPELRR